MIRVRPRRRALIAVPVAVLTLAGCSQSSDDSSRSAKPTAGPNASDAACTTLMTRLPKTVLSRTRNPAQEPAGIATWGDPAIGLSCGAAPTGPTSDQCIEVNAVNWVFRETTADYTFLTYGRDPAVLVQVPKSGVERTEATSALVDLEGAVAPLKKDKHTCLDLSDTAPTATPG